jgi:hypothetical protein
MLVRAILATAVFLTATGISAPTTVLAQEVVSEVSEILAAKATKLPEGPHPKKGDDNCAYDFADPKTEAGRYVLQRGWGVLSEATIGGYQLVSFAGEFISGTSGSCAIQQGNIGVFEGSKLRAILYTASKNDELIGVLVPTESRTVRIWSGDYLGYPVADISGGSFGLIVGKVADADTFCKGAVSVPNVFDLPITEARTKLFASGWEGVPQPKEEWGQQVDLHELGITEAASCSGTGFGFCSYAYHTAGATMELTTAGELFEDNLPGVADYSVTCAP